MIKTKTEKEIKIERKETVQTEMQKKKKCSANQKVFKENEWIEYRKPVISVFQLHLRYHFNRFAFSLYLSLSHSPFQSFTFCFAWKKSTKLTKVQWEIVKSKSIHSTNEFQEINDFSEKKKVVRKRKKRISESNAIN